MFCYPENIEGEAKKLFTPLKQDGYLKESVRPRILRGNRHTFLSELNAIHAFRKAQRPYSAVILPSARRAGRTFDRP